VFNVPFQHKYMTISGTRGSRVESYRYPVQEGQRYINLNPGRLFIQQPPKKERDREAHLNYYTSAASRNNRGVLLQMWARVYRRPVRPSLAMSAAIVAPDPDLDTPLESGPRPDRPLQDRAEPRRRSSCWKSSRNKNAARLCCTFRASWTRRTSRRQRRHWSPQRLPTPPARPWPSPTLARTRTTVDCVLSAASYPEFDLPVLPDVSDTVSICLNRLCGLESDFWAWPY